MTFFSLIMDTLAPVSIFVASSAPIMITAMRIGAGPAFCSDQRLILCPVHFIHGIHVPQICVAHLFVQSL